MEALLIVSIQCQKRRYDKEPDLTESLLMPSNSSETSLKVRVCVCVNPWLCESFSAPEPRKKKGIVYVQIPKEGRSRLSSLPS